MKCKYCSSIQKPIDVKGIVIIVCCGKVQVLKSSLRPKPRRVFEQNGEVDLI